MSTSSSCDDNYDTIGTIIIINKCIATGIATVMGTAGCPVLAPACQCPIKGHSGRCRSQCPRYWEKTPAHCLTAAQAVWWRRWVCVCRLEKVTLNLLLNLHLTGAEAIFCCEDLLLFFVYAGCFRAILNYPVNIDAGNTEQKHHSPVGSTLAVVHVICALCF